MESSYLFFNVPWAICELIFKLREEQSYRFLLLIWTDCHFSNWNIDGAIIINQINFIL